MDQDCSQQEEQRSPINPARWSRSNWIIFSQTSIRSSTSLALYSRNSQSRGLCSKQVRLFGSPNFFFIDSLKILTPLGALQLSNMVFSPGIFTSQIFRISSKLLTFLSFSYSDCWLMQTSNPDVSNTFASLMFRICFRAIESCRQSCNIFILLPSSNISFKNPTTSPNSFSSQPPQFCSIFVQACWLIQELLLVSYVGFIFQISNTNICLCSISFLSLRFTPEIWIKSIYPSTRSRPSKSTPIFAHFCRYLLLYSKVFQQSTTTIRQPMNYPTYTPYFSHLALNSFTLSSFSIILALGSTTLFLQLLKRVGSMMQALLSNGQKYISLPKSKIVDWITFFILKK